MAAERVQGSLSQMVAGARTMIKERLKVGDLVMLMDGPDRGEIGVVVEVGEVWSNILGRTYPEYDVKIERVLLRCMSGFYLEKIG